MLTILLFPFLSFFQDSPEAIFKNAAFYEFSPDRKRIVILAEDHSLHKYSTETGLIRQILPAGTIEPDTYLVRGSHTPLFVANSGVIYITGEHFVFRIQNDKLSKIPFLYEEYRAGAITSETSARDRKRRAVLAQKLMQFRGKRAGILFDNIYILEYPDGNGSAFYLKTFRKLDESVQKHIENYIDADFLKRDRDESYSRENLSFRRLMNTFDNGSVKIKENLYFCQVFRSTMAMTPAPCWYEIDVDSENISATLKDRNRRSRHLFRGGEDLWWNGNLYERLPYSRRIQDHAGNIWLLFYGDEEGRLDLLKISSQ